MKLGADAADFEGTAAAAIAALVSLAQLLVEVGLSLLLSPPIVWSFVT